MPPPWSNKFILMMMKKYWLLIFYSSIASVAFCQQNYWQQEVNYKIDVTLNDKAHSIKGNINIEYINNSPDTLSFIWFHLWPNAYKNDNTALNKQMSGDKESVKKRKKLDKGYIDSLNFMSAGSPMRIEPDPDFIDVIKLWLLAPLPPGKRISISTPFFVKIPGYFSRLGHVGNSYMISQWYPKPAVYDSKGWHPIPYLDQGEFYSEFGSYDVSVTLPASYIVGATGILQTEPEKAAYITTGDQNHRLHNLNQAKHESYKPYKTGNKTLSWHAEKVHDFAWFADKNFVIDHDTLALESGRIIDVYSFAQPKSNGTWNKATEFIEDAVKHYSNWIGEYPYPVVNAVEGPKNDFSGGMEYPMVTIITSPDKSEAETDGVITHEVGHNWFYATLGTNERDHPWMDEGLNTYYQFRYEAYKYRMNSVFGNAIPEAVTRLSADKFMERVYGALLAMKLKEPIETKSVDFKDKQ